MNKNLLLLTAIMACAGRTAYACPLDFTNNSKQTFFLYADQARTEQTIDDIKIPVIIQPGKTGTYPSHSIASTGGTAVPFYIYRQQNNDSKNLDLVAELTQKACFDKDENFDTNKHLIIGVNGNELRITKDAQENFDITPRAENFRVIVSSPSKSSSRKKNRKK